MIISRRGKIARFPEEIRRQLNQRLRDGEPGTRLVEWLNSLPVTQSVLAAEFGGQPVTGPNLSAWKQGGYAVWLEQQEALEVAGPVAAELTELAQATGGPITDQMALWLAARYLVVAREREGSAESAEATWCRLRELLRDVSVLRRGDHDAQRLKLAHAKFSMAQKDSQSVAMESLLEAAKKYPEVMESFRSAFRLLKERTAGTA
jgi:hypothetical protein